MLSATDNVLCHHRLLYSTAVYLIQTPGFNEKIQCLKSVFQILQSHSKEYSSDKNSIRVTDDKKITAEQEYGSFRRRYSYNIFQGECKAARLAVQIRS
jgi:hypothetical protein